jgi:transcriptional regulator with XRE-family HTH domain
MVRASEKSIREIGHHPRSPKPLDTHVGVRVRTRRLTLGMSQTELGDAIGITFQQIQKYEKGTNRIGASRLQQIADALQVPISFFFQEWSGAEFSSSTNNPAGGVAEISRALATNAGIELMRAFVKIKDENLRRHLVRLATAIAEGQTKKN